mgnify:FL=1
MQLEQKEINSYTKLYIASNSHKSFRELSDYFKNNKQKIMDEIHQYGIVIFRGFENNNSEQFQILIEKSLSLQPCNAFNPNMPAWIATCMRKYSENVLGAGDYRRYIGRNTVQLGPVENSIQGPHVEGGVRSERSRYIALFCQEPSTHLAETGFNNLELIWENFPDSIKKKYLGAWNHFSYVSARKINVIDRLLLKKSPFSIGMRPDKKAKLTLKPTPFVIFHPNTKKIVVQPWAFANNTNSFAYCAAKQCFEKRGSIDIDSTAENMQLTWEIYSHVGEKIEWSDEEKQHFFNSMYGNALLLEWHKGDIALVDNIKIAHWRMNGDQGNRKLIQIQANVFNAVDYSAV